MLDYKLIIIASFDLYWILIKQYTDIRKMRLTHCVSQVKRSISFGTQSKNKNVRLMFFQIMHVYLLSTNYTSKIVFHSRQNIYVLNICLLHELYYTRNKYTFTYLVCLRPLRLSIQITDKRTQLNRYRFYSTLLY